VAVAHGVHVQHTPQQLGEVKGASCLCHAAVALIEQLQQVASCNQLPLHVTKAETATGTVLVIAV